MEPNLFKYVWRHSRKDQIWLLVVVLLSMVPYFLSFDLPKQIVNGPIQGIGFPDPDSTAKFLPLFIPVPGFISESGYIELFSGFDLERMSYLVGLCMLFLALVCINGMFKFYINTYKGRLGERMLRRLRFELVDRVLRFPLRAFRKIKAPEVATMVKDEVEPLGEFIGDAFIQPIFLGSQAITAMVFIMVQNVWLGLIAAAIVLVQAVVIPRLRRQLVALGKLRQITARRLAGRVGEIVDGITEIRVNDATNYERADLSNRLGRIFFIRYQLFRKKFMIKFLNNFLSQFTPFLFYFIGGYFAIRGQLDIGQLVAVIAAYKDLPPPIREMINWDQQRMNVQVKYAQVIEQFQPEAVIARELQPVAETPPGRLAGEIAANNVGVVDDTGATLLDGASFTLSLDEKTAVLGAQGSGAATAGELIARLIAPTTGRVTLAGQNLADLPESVSGRRLAYVGQDSYLRQESIWENLLYGLKRYPADGGPEEEPIEGSAISNELRAAEIRSSGNIDLHPLADWVDYEAAGAKDAAGLEDIVTDLLEKVQLEEDIFELGLRGKIDPVAYPDIAEKVMQARSALRERLAHEPLAGLVEHFDPEKYNSQVSVAGNLLFSTSGDVLGTEQMTTNPFLLSVLADEGLDSDLFEMGRQIAETVTELFADLPPDHPFFQQLTFMDAEELPEYQSLLTRVAGTDFINARKDDRTMLLRLAFAYVEPRLRLGLLDDALRERIVKARKTFHETVPDELRAQMEFYEVESYNKDATLEDNILFGRIAHGVADGPKRVREAMRAVLEELHLRETVSRVGLQFDVGVGGRRLSGQQRQRLALVRALLKRPDYMILNQPFSGFDTASKRMLSELVFEQAKGSGDYKGFGLLWVLGEVRGTELFDTVLLVAEGRLVEQGDPETVSENPLYQELLSVQ